MPTADQRKEQLANQLIRTHKAHIVVSTQVINEVVHNLLRKGNFNEPAIRALIASYYGHFSVVSLTQSQQIKASRLRESYSLSHYDSLIVAAVLEAGAFILSSEDMQDGLVIDEQLTIQNPFRS